MGGVPTDSVVDLCGRPSATKVRPLDVPETCTLRVGSPVFQVSFANIPKETVRFHWGAYNAVGQCQSADTEYKTRQCFVLCGYQCTNELFCGFRVLTPDCCLIPLSLLGILTLRIGLLCGALRKHGTRKETREKKKKKAPNGFGVQEFESVFLPNSKRKHAGLGGSAVRLAQLPHQTCRQRLRSSSLLGRAGTPATSAATHPAVATRRSLKMLRA